VRGTNVSTLTTDDQSTEYSRALVSHGARWFRGQRRARLERAIEAADLPTRPGARTLDLGCADGILWPDLEHRVGRIVGVNHDQWHTRQCRERFPDGTVMQGDARRLPFADESFDLLFCLEMFNYVARPDRLTVVKELRRVLRPGGRAVVSVPIEVGLPGLLKFMLRGATRSYYPGMSTHFHMLWRRLLYRFVDLREDRRRWSFHFNPYELAGHVRSVFGNVRCRRVPFFYPFVTTVIISADKSATAPGTPPSGTSTRQSPGTMVLSRSTRMASAAWCAACFCAAVAPGAKRTVTRVG